MSLLFRAYDAGDGTTGVWADEARAVWSDLTAARDPDSTITDDDARRILGELMPELLPVLDRLVEAVDRPGAATLLSHLALKSPFAACTQTSVDGMLLRNYDFEARHCDRLIVRSNFLRPVLGMNDVLWGMLDGVNDAGLAVSLTYGGRPDSGPGLSVLLVVRYLLETCDTVAEAWTAIRRLPFATVQNLTLVDRDEAMSVYVGPDREAAPAPDVCVANHQDRPVSREQERATRTKNRQRTLKNEEQLLKPPVYVPFNGEFGTLYTAIYKPREGRVTYLWPDARIEQSITNFTSNEWTVLG